MSELFKQIAEKASAYEMDCANILVDLVKTPSYSCKEKEVIQVIKEKMLENGFDEVQIDGLGNVLGRIGNGKRIIAFDAHIDTVYPGELSLWDYDPYDSKVVNNKVRGRGSVDQKGGMASMITAGKIIKEMGLNQDFTIYFTGTVNEEDCDGQCWQYIINESQLKPELVVITEPTNLNIYRGHRGRMEMTVSIKGVSCHGSAPERGDNAVYKMARIALELEKLNEELHYDPFLGKGTLVVSELKSSGPSQCAVPDYASLYIDRRLTKGEDKELAVRQVKEAAKRAGYEDAEVLIPQYNEPAYTGLSYPVEKYYPTWVLDPESPYLIDAVDSFKQLFDKEPLVDKWTFSTNGVSIMGRYGIPCIGFGPGNEVYAHAPNEECPTEHLSTAAAFYAGLVAKLNGK
jgi:putative selenium metabolism hydrolase